MLLWPPDRVAVSTHGVTMLSDAQLPVHANVRGDELTRAASEPLSSTHA